MLVLLTLSALAMAAAALVSTRARFTSRAEFLLSCCVLWNFLILVPIHVLGLLNRLTPLNLGIAAALFFLGVGGASFVGVPSRRAHLDEAIAMVRRCLLVPGHALAETARARSFALIGVAAAFAVITWTIWLSYLAPSDSWDGLWYHEVTIGFTVQNHGYLPIDLPVTRVYPASMIQQANGYPRNCEMTNLWFVIFSGRDLVEVVNSLAAVPLMLATYLIARRASDDRSTAMGWAAGLALMPGIAMQYRTTYMDVHVAALYLSALHFCTRPAMRIPDGWIAMIAISLFIGAKSMALATAPVLWVAMAALLLRRHWHTDRRRALAVLGGGTVIILAMAAVCYVRNWVLFGGPLWPISLDLPRLGIHFRGLCSPETIMRDEGRLTMADTIHRILEYRAPGKDYADTGSWAYGIGVSFILLPIALACSIALAVSLLRLAYRRWIRREPASDDDGPTWNTGLVALILVLAAITSPKLWVPRYNIQLVAGLMFVTGWYARKTPRLSDAVGAAVIAGGLVFLYWASPGWGVTIESAMRYARMTHEERDVLSPSPWGITPEVARARDAELGPGDVVACSEDTTFIFVTQLWNERYTNKVVYVKPTSVDAFLAGAEKVHAKWAVVGADSTIAGELRRRSSEWEPIGLASRGYPQTAFRRKR